MDTKPRWHELVERATNFHGDSELFQKQALKNEAFFSELQRLRECIVIEIDTVHELNSGKILEMVFTKVYNFVMMSNSDYVIFGEDTYLYDDVFDACFFTTLCMFLHDTKRIKAMSLSAFLYKHSSMRYNVKETPNYFDYKYTYRASTHRISINAEDTAFRQKSYRQLSTRAVYNERSEGSAIRKDSEYEWSFYRVLNNLDPKLKDTFNRIGRLYNDINNVLDSTKDEGFQKRLETAVIKFSRELKGIDYKLYDELSRALNSPKDKGYRRRVEAARRKLTSKLRNTDYKLYDDINKELAPPKDEAYQKRLEDAYKRFLSKLKKIDYGEFLELQKEILSHICKNKKYYGMNIYRFEKELRLFTITSEVNRLLECKDENEEWNALLKFVALNDLHFPRLHQVFTAFDDSAYTALGAKIFYPFINIIVVSSRLILDEFVENGFFGENWEDFFLDTINKMTERVFYDPEKIDCTAKPGSQEKFMKIISVPVRAMLF